MKRGVIAGTLAAVVLLLAACGGDDDEAPSLAAWATGACGIATDFQSAVAAVAGGLADSTTLSLDDRLARAERLGRTYVEESQRAAAALRELSAASGVGTYHSALIEQFGDLAEGARALTEATSAQELEEQNAELNIVFEQTAREVAAAAEQLPDDAAAALRGVTNCGLVS